ncbi:hypothetical protein [Bifidobacterium asteroides]|uniref:hypothetical protein n=1 Tax=Bifidobacterium asteroides TaxID=1684 RepID=UPI001C695BCA|nr:hypothetical protein [Bifidobacterium asteroides]
MMACALAGGLLAWHSLFEAGIHPPLAGSGDGAIGPCRRVERHGDKRGFSRYRAKQT